MFLSHLFWCLFFFIFLFCFFTLVLQRGLFGGAVSIGFVLPMYFYYLHTIDQYRVNKFSYVAAYRNKDEHFVS